MGTVKEFARKFQLRERALVTQKVAELKRCFTSPEVLPKVASFCDHQSKRACISMCATNKNCTCGCEQVRDALLEGIVRRGLGVTVGSMRTGCDGHCQKGVIIGFPQMQFFYVGVKTSDVPRILDETIVRGKLIFPLLSFDPERSYRSDIFYDKHSGMIAGIDEKVCMVDVAKYFLDFEDNLSCGKCVPCRIGMKRALECVGRIANGEGTEEDLEQILALCSVMEQTPNCEFANMSIRPLRSAVSYFENEFRAHYEKKVCSAGVCKTLVEYQRKLAVRERLSLKTK
jgi:(2Fe-2S) ferredoxin